MALTRISTAGVKDDAVTAGKIPADAVGSSEIAANAVGSSELADDAVDTAAIAANAVSTAKIADEAITLAKLVHGTSSNDGKFLRANNGADPTFETISIPVAFPSGTKMLFQQTSAPTGWTKITSSVNNKALRVVSGTASSGGTNAFTTAFGSRGINANAGNTTATGNVSSSAGNTTAGGNVSVANATQGGNVSIGNTTAGGNVSISSVSTSGNVNSHTLSTNEMPSHSHGTNACGGGGDNRGNAGGGYTTGRLQNRSCSNTNATGGNGGHSHGFSGSSHNHNGSLSGTAHNHNASFSGSAHSHNASFSGSAHNHNVSSTFSGSAHNHSISVGNLDMAVQYLDVIIASKD